MANSLALIFKTGQTDLVPFCLLILVLEFAKIVIYILIAVQHLSFELLSSLIISGGKSEVNWFIDNNKPLFIHIIFYSHHIDL